MAFSFFRKKETEAEARPAMPGAPAAVESPPSKPVFADEGHQATAGIEVVNGGDVLTPAEEQAAILHANGASEEALAVLRPELERIRGQHQQQTWLMLFELQQQLGKQADYEALGLEYVLEFEKTPPPWQVARAHFAKQPPAANSLCTFGRNLNATSVSTGLSCLQQAAGKDREIRLDFSRVEEIDALAAAEILAAWHMVRKHTPRFRIYGGSTFARLLAGKIETGRRLPAEAPFWLLLMDVFQASGLQEEFENLAVEYAITYEVSPPSWDANLVPLPDDGETLSRENSPLTPLPTEGFSPQGDITGEDPASLAQIRDHALHSTGPLVLDFNHVNRLDFESAGQLLNLFMQVLQAGRSIRLTAVNELVFALLQLMGITELTTIERRKS